MRFLLLAVAFVLFGFSESEHDYHVSRLTINLNTKTQRLEFTLDTFVDDVERVLGEQAKLIAGSDFSVENCDLVTPKEHPAADSLYGIYLQDVLRITLDGKAAQVRYLGKEAATDPYAMYAYLEVPLTEAQATQGALVGLSSRYFTSVYDDQQNIIVWKKDGEAIGYKLLTRARTRTTQQL